MLIEQLKRIDVLSGSDLAGFLKELTLGELISYWAFVASQYDRDEEKDKLCREEYFSRQ